MGPYTRCFQYIRFRGFCTECSEKNRKDREKSQRAYKKMLANRYGGMVHYYRTTDIPLSTGLKDWP